MGRRRVQVHRQDATGTNLRRELAPATAQVQHRAFRWHERLEEILYKDRPHCPSIIAILVKSTVVGICQLPGGAVNKAASPCAISRRCHASTISAIVSSRLLVIDHR